MQSYNLAYLVMLDSTQKLNLALVFDDWRVIVLFGAVLVGLLLWLLYASDLQCPKCRKMNGLKEFSRVNEGSSIGTRSVRKVTEHFDSNNKKTGESVSYENQLATITRWAIHYKCKKCGEVHIKYKEVVS